MSVRNSLLQISLAAGLALGKRSAGAQTMELTEPISVMSFTRSAIELTPEDRQHLGAAVEWLQAHPWRLLVIEGYGDRTGRPTTNLQLAQDRADAARRALIE